MAKYFHKIVYHQVIMNPRKIKELKTMPCYKYKLIRPIIGTVNLANLKIMFSWVQIKFTTNAKKSMQVMFMTFDYSYIHGT